MYVSKTFTFEASHQIANHPGKCRRLHGHSWVLTVTCQGKLDPITKMVKDFYDIKQAVQPIVDKLDHQHLGEGEVIHFNGMEPDYKVWLLSTVEGMIPGFTPTSENLLVWIASQIPTTLPWCKLEINETCTSSAVLERWEHTRYFLKEGGNHGRQEEGDKEGNEEGKEVPAQEGKKVASPPIDIDAYIRDDDIPF